MDERGRHKAQMVKKMIEVQQRNQPKCNCAKGNMLDAGKEVGKEMKAAINDTECDLCWHNRAIEDEGKQGKDSKCNDRDTDGITKESPFEAKYDSDKIKESEELMDKILALDTWEACRLLEGKSSTTNEFFKMRTFEPRKEGAPGAEVGGNNGGSGPSGGGQGEATNTKN